MCSKFTAMVSWTEQVDFADTSAEMDNAGNDRSVAYRVMDWLPVIVFDRELGRRRLLATLPIDRMPVFLVPEYWEASFSEKPSGIDRTKACLKTVEGVRWTTTREKRAKTARRTKPVVTDPPGPF
jgi:hypothetical protein